MHRTSIALVALGYAVGAGAWILLSDVALYQLWDGAESFYRIGLIKGLAFVGVTSVILYALVRALTASMRRSEARLDATFELAAVGIAHLSPDGRWLRVNRQLCAITGYAREELLAGRAQDITHPDDAAGDRDLLRRLLAGEIVSVAREKRYLRKDGTTVWVAVKAALVRDANGRPDYIVSVIEDITQRRQAAEALREHEQQLQLITDAMPAMVVRLDREGRYLFVNETAARTFGRSKADMIGRKRTEVLGPRLEAAYAPHFERVLAGERVVFEAENALPSGTRHAWVTLIPERSPDGSVRGYLGVAVDITERKRAEDALRRSERRLRAIIETEPECVKLVNASGGLVEMNPAGLAMLEAGSVEQAQRAGLLSFILPDYRAKFRELHRRVMQGEAGTLEFEIVGLKGTRRWLETHAAPMRDDAGKVTMLLGITRDVTERKRLETKAAESALRMEMIVRAANVGLWDWDLLTNKVFFSREWKRQLGCDDHEISDDFSEWETRLHPEDRARALRATQAALEVPEAGYEAEFRLRHKNGSYRSILAQGAVLIGDDGKPARMLGSHIDLTELRRMEQAVEESAARMRAIADNSPMGITLKGLDGRYLFVNKRFGEWHGVRPEDAVGKTTADLFPGRATEAMEEQEHGLIASGRSSRREETVVFRDGSLHRLQIVKFLVPGPALAIGSLAIDVTEQRQIEEHLRQAQKLEAVGQLTGGVAHDFNNLLSVILGNFEILGDLAAGEPDGARAVQRGISATRRGAELTGRLLAFSRRQALNPRAVDINALITETAHLLARTLGGSIAIRTAFGEGVRAVFVDAGQLENAFLNLALNARDAMPRGGTLTFETANVSIADGAAHESGLAAGDYVLVTVRDTGTGMTPEVAARAFEPFFTTKEIGKGSGLGLSMVYGFVTQSGGHVTIDSAVGRGTAFRLYLPAAASEPVRPRAAKAKVAKGGGQRILLLEDDPFVRETVMGQLETLDYRVTPVASADEALAQLGSGAGFDLLLTDIVLPGGTSGIDVAETVRRAQPMTRLLFMSGYAKAPAGEERIAALGASLLLKPFAIGDLSRAIERALRMPAACGGAVEG